MDTIITFIRACRPQQWAKNLLLAVPMIVGQQWADETLWLPLALAFVFFGLAASAAYLVNDLRDLESDRVHPTKKNRPLASGALAPRVAAIAAPVMIAAALGGSWLLLPHLFVWSLAAYVVTTLLYSMWVKRKAMLDVIWLACLYSLRIIAGGMAVGITPSAWLLAFTLFIFLSIAFAKRYSEMLLLRDEGHGAVRGRGYELDDDGLVAAMGVTSGYLAVLVLALYIHSEDVDELYTQPQALWLMCPLLLYWISRLWLRARHREMRDDPLLFALTDPVSYAVAILGAAIILIAR